MMDNPFLITAFFAAILASVASGVIGTFVVIKRIVFISGSIAHSVLGGMGFFLWLSYQTGSDAFNPLIGAFIASILSALLIGWIHLKFKQRRDAIIAGVWSTGMALGVIFISLTPGYSSDMMNFLFGNILWTTMPDLLGLLALDLVLVLSVGFFYSRFLAITFDEMQAELKGLKVRSLYFFLLILIAISIVLLIQVIGIILVIALLSLPAMTASLFTKKLLPMMGFATLIALAYNVGGIMLSFTLNLPTGASIALTAAILYMVILFLKSQVSKTI